MSISTIVMSYKESCRIEGVILTKFKIAKLIYRDKLDNDKIAKIFACHRNTVSKIKRLIYINKNLNKHIMDILTTDKKVSYEQIINTFDFLKNTSTKPRGNRKSLKILDHLKVLGIFWNTNYSYQRIFNTLRIQGYDTKYTFTLGKIRKILRDN
jgi:hypothetical protein